AADFIDDLSNWYIRRNRRRFWRSRTAGDQDKLAAYQTLYEVLLTLAKLLSPMMPFFCERMYQNLVINGLGAESGKRKAGNGQEAASDSAFGFRLSALPQSVHLCDYPQPNPDLLDASLNQRMAAAQLIVRLGHKLREDSNLRV